MAVITWEFRQAAGREPQRTYHMQWQLDTQSGMVRYRRLRQNRNWRKTEWSYRTPGPKWRALIERKRGYRMICSEGDEGCKIVGVSRRFLCKNGMESFYFSIKYSELIINGCRWSPRGQLLLPGEWITALKRRIAIISVRPTSPVFKAMRRLCWDTFGARCNRP
jgi:hypothetical protein